MPDDASILDATGLPGPLTVVVGPEELLVERAVSTVAKSARADDPSTDVREVRGGDLTPPALDEFLSPSLFGERRVLVLRGLGVGGADDDGDDGEDDPGSGGGALDPAVLDRLVAHAGSGQADVHVVVVHREANRGRAQLNVLRKAGRVVECKRVKKGKPLTEFVAAELRALDRPFTADVPGAIVLAVGPDLRALASACSQLAIEGGGAGRLTGDDVEAFFAGRVEADAFAIADAVLEGRTPAALGLARHALAVGTGGPAITAAMAYALRTMVTASAAPRSGTMDEQAAAVGMPAWKLRKARAQLAGWTPDSVGRALRATADADAEVKGAAVDADYAVERLIIRIGRARAAR